MSDFYELHKKMLQKYGSESSANEGKKQKATQSRPETPRNAYVTSDGGKTDAYKNFMNLHKSIQKKYEKVKAGPETAPSTPVMKIAPVLASNSQKTNPAYTPTRTRQEYETAISSGKQELSRLEELLGKKQDLGTFLRNTYTMTPAAAAAQEAAEQDGWAKEYGYGSWKEAKDRYDSLQRELYFLESGMEYDEIPTIPGFEQASKVDSSYKNDDTYSYINNIDGFRNRQYAGAMSGSGANKTFAGYDKMTDYEVGTYNAIYATEGKEAAEKYLEYLSYSLSERDAQEAKENAEYFAQKAPVLSDIMSTPMNLVGGVEGAVDVLGQKVAQGVTGQYKPTDFNRGTLAAQAGSAIREYRTEQLNDLSGTIQIDAEKNPILSRFLNGKGVGDLYQLGMSMVDSGAAAGISAISGTGWLGGALLGTSAGTQAMIEAANSGATDSQAIWTGLTSGAFEMLFEKVSIDRLLSYDGKNIIKSVLTQGVVEGSEEAATSVANTIADIFIMAADSEWSELVGQYTAAGDDLETARWKALRDKAVDIAYDFSAGFLTGGLMGGGATAMQNVTTRMEETAAYREALPELVAESGELSGETELGTRIQEQMDAGQKVATRDINRLVAQNEAAIAEQTATQAEVMLTERGETGNVAEVAQVVGKMATGQRLTRQEMQIFRESQNAADVLNEINEAEATTEMPVQEATETAQEAKIPTPVEVEGESQKIAPVEEIGQESPSVPAPAAEVTEPTETGVKAVQGAALYEDEVREIEAHSKQYGEQAEAYLESFDAGQNVAEYDAAWRAGYELGMSQVPQAQALESSDLAYLTPGQRVDAYEAGLRAAGVMATRQEARVAAMGNRAVTGTRKLGTVRAYPGLTLGDLQSQFNDSQKKAYKILSEIAKVTGIDIVLYRTEANADGDFEGAQGKYIRSEPGRIYLDVNAGLSNVSEVGDMANYTMLATFTHEFVHFCENWNPVRYNELRKVVFETMAERGVNVEDRIDQMIQDSGGELSREGASREVVAESLVEILPEATFVEKLANEHKTLFRKLLERMKEFLEEIKDYFAGMRKSSDPAVAALKEEVDGVTRYVEGIVKLFDNVATEAVNKAQSAAMGEFVEYDAESQSIAPAQLSRRTWNESEYTQKKEAAVVAISLQLGVSREQARKYINDIDSIAALIGDDAVRLDYEPNLDPLATVIKPNSEYKWTVDMSTLCAKRLWYTGTFDAIQRRLGNAVFDSDAMIKLRSMMMEAGYEVACGICYVESTRREIGPITQEFINRYKEAQKTGEPIQRINAEGKALVLKGKGRKDPFYTEDGYTPTMADLNTTDIDLVKRDHPEVYEAYLAFMNARGQAKPKLLETRAEYKGEILKHFKAVSAVKSRNEHGGLRLQSFSDFEVPHMIDMMQIVMDMSRVGLKSQAYTKVPAFADIFGGTGVKINLSLIAKGSGLDANGNLVFDDVEGMPHEEAFRLRDKWSDNVGTILVGKNDDHIRAAMQDPRIDFIIPFHKSSWKESLYDALGLTGYENYTEAQNEKPLDPSRNIKNFDPSEYWDYTKTGDENAEIYLEKCRADGRQPKFPQFAGEPGYWKLLIDFKMYNNNGVGTPQQIVKPEYDMDAARKVLADYKGGHQKLPVAKDIVEKFVAEYENGTQSQRRPVTAIRDAAYMDAVNRGDMETAQRMVNERAEELRAEVFAQTDVPTYRIRRRPAPKATIPVYKVFTMSETGKPSALFVSSQYDLPIGVWLDAQDTFHFTDQRNGHMYVPSTKNPNTKGGATGRPINVADISDAEVAELERRGYLKRDKNGKLPKTITSLAYRPGWHAGDLPFFPQGGMQIEGSNYPNVHRYNQVVFECEMIADHDYTDYHVTEDGRVQLHDMQHMPDDGSYKYSTNPMAQSTDIGAWYIGSSIRIVRALTQEECDRILQAKGRPVQEWQAYQDPAELQRAKAEARKRFTDKKDRDKAAKDAEYAYEHRYGVLDLDALGYDPTQTDGGKKLLDPVTYDDDGNVIPLSERFNEDNPDIRYQRRNTNRLSDFEVLEAAAAGLEGLALTEEEQNSLGIMRQKLARLSPITEQIGEHERLASEFAESNPTEAQKERNRASVLKRKRTAELNAILAGANGPIMRRVLQKARSIVEKQEVAEYREARRESELAKRYKARIEKDVNELITWGLKPDTKNALKHIPEGIKGPVMDFIEAVDFSSKRQLAGGAPTQKDERFLEKMATLKKVLEPMRPNGEENLDKTRLSEEFFVKLDDLSNNITRTAQAIHSFDAGVIVNEMKSSDLKRLADIIKGLKRLITEYNRTYKNAMYESIDKAGKNSVEIMQKMKPLKSNAATEFLEFDQTRPAYIFERFGEGGKSIWQELQNGQSRFGFMAKEIIDFSEKTYTAKEVKAWEKEVKTIKLSDDSTVEMTIAQIMSLYKLQAREQALGHLLGNGIRIPNYKIGNKKYTDNGHFLNQEDIDNICGVLTARQKAVADKLQAFMQETGSQWGNEVTMVRFGERLFGEKNYFPIHSDGGNIPGTLDEHLESQSLYAMLNMGFTKRTQEGANNRIIVHSIFEEYAAHMSNMAKYNAFALPVLDTLRWLNYTDEQNRNIGVRQEMARVYGRRSGSDKATAELFVTNLLKALNGTENASLKKTEQTAIRLLGRYNRAQVAANLSVAIQQPLSIIRSVEEFGAGSLIVAMGTNTKAIRKNWKEMEEHSGIAVWKQLGFYDINISRGLSSMIKHDESTVDKLTEWSMGAASFADRLTWGWMWEIAKQEVKQKKKLKPSDEGYWDAVTKAFEDVIYKTQVVDSPLTKTEAMRSNSFWAKSIYSFMSEPITALSMTTNAVSQFRRGIAEGKSASELWRTNGKKMIRTFMVNAVAIIFNAAVTAALRDALRDDDEYENYGEKFMQAFRKNLFSELIPLNNIPELSGMLNGVLLTLKDIGVIEGEFADSIFEEKSTTESILDAIKNAVYIPYQKIWGKGSNYTWYGAVYNALKAASGITGLPAASGIRELVTMWNNTMAPILGKLYPKSEWVLRTYEPDPKQEIREAFENGYLTEEEVAKELEKAKVVDSNGDPISYKGTAAYWAYKAENPDADVESTWFEKYHDDGNAKNAGIKMETYLEYRQKAKGKQYKKDLLPIMHGMNLTRAQKDALYREHSNWSEEALSEAPWH